MLVTTPALQTEYYQALLDKNPAYLSTFLAAVKTTGIFCVSTCRARKPLAKNVAFYTSVEDVLIHGYRPCKICKPQQKVNEPPAEIQAALALLEDQPQQRVTDQHLREAGLVPATVRRWFNKHHGVTFQAYQRMIRINKAYQALKKGADIGAVAHDSSYDSISGFGYTFQKYLQKSPAAAKHQAVILISRLDTPIGPMFVCATDEGICLLEFTDRRMLETEFEDLQRRLRAVILHGENNHIAQAKKELAEYFAGERSVFSVPLHTPTTPFRQQVWDLLVQLPHGTTTSYGEQASRIGNPKAVRAVANANGHNRVAIIIPCHRVIGSDGSLTGYAGGLHRKEWLLRHEGALPDERQGSLFS